MTNYRTKKGREILETKISEYFSMCDRLNESADKKPVKPYTVSGLLYYLDMSKNEFEGLCESRALSKIIGGAKRRIEAYIEENALSGRISSSASINSLKEHFGWNEKDGSDEADVFSIELCDEAKKLGT